MLRSSITLWNSREGAKFSKSQSLMHEPTMQDINNFAKYLEYKEFRKRISEEQELRIKEYCKEYPELTVRERCVKFGYKKSRMHELLKLAGQSNKNLSPVDIRVNEELVAEFEDILSSIINDSTKSGKQDEVYTFVYLDEAGVELTPMRRRGWGNIGKRIPVKFKYEPKKRVNILGAVIFQYKNGKLISNTRNNFIALGHCDKSINAPTFESWFANILLPKLPANTYIVMDNARFHKRPITEEMARNAGHKILWLPPYSPFLNKIEKKWAQIKNLYNRVKCSVLEAIYEFMTPEEKESFCSNSSKVERIEYPEKL